MINSKRLQILLPLPKTGIPFKVLFFLFALVLFPNNTAMAQADSSYSFLVAGHGYGSHSGGNIGLHPPLLTSLNSGFANDAAYIILTGDIVNLSNTESWKQVEDELTLYPFESYYVMGNHDDNSVGHSVFEAKHGNTYYSFTNQSALFIVLNSTEDQRSIADTQLVFLEEELTHTGDSLKNIFVFFHEIIWNSHEKYIAVRSNSRSRYDQIVNYSNYWDEVHPLFLQYPTKNFYIIAGDVGGNADAIAIFYDKWDNVTLIASGMGEVADENYLTVHMHNEDSIDFELIALREETALEELTFYGVPEAPDTLLGPTNVMQRDSGIEYSVPEVFNATSYVWEIPDGVSGSSSMESILLDFSTNFLEGDISVMAARDGYGNSPPCIKKVTASVSPIHSQRDDTNIIEMIITPHTHLLNIEVLSPVLTEAQLSIYSINGQNIYSSQYLLKRGVNTINIEMNRLQKGVNLIRLRCQNQLITEKIAIR